MNKKNIEFYNQKIKEKHINTAALHSTTSQTIFPPQSEHLQYSGVV